MPTTQNDPGASLLSEDDVRCHPGIPGDAGHWLLEGDVWGHRKDLDEYYTVDEATIEEIRTLAASGASAEDIANQIQKKAKLGADLIKYIAKTEVPA